MKGSTKNSTHYQTEWDRKMRFESEVSSLYKIDESKSENLKRFQQYAQAISGNDWFDFVRAIVGYHTGLGWADDALRELIRERAPQIRITEMYEKITLNTGDIEDDEHSFYKNAIQQSETQTALAILDALLGQEKAERDILLRCRGKEIHPGALYYLTWGYLALVEGHYLDTHVEFLYALTHLLFSRIEELSINDQMKDALLVMLIELFPDEIPLKITELSDKYLSVFGRAWLMVVADERVGESRRVEKREILDFIAAHLDEFDYKRMIEMAANPDRYEGQLNLILYIAVGLKGVEQTARDILDIMNKKENGKTYMNYLTRAMGGFGMYRNLFDEDTFEELRRRL